MELASRVGLVAVLGALLLRFGTSAAPQKLADVMATPAVAQFILLTQTGLKTTPKTLPFHEAESAVPEWKTPVSFSREDAQLVSLHSSVTQSVDIPALLTQPLQWDLYGNEPKVLILHTHTSESYSGTTGYRSMDEEENMLAVGTALAQELEAAGIGVIHDRNYHDYPSYNGAYTHARGEIEAYLAQYPSICLVLDLHRDAISDSRGNQLAYTCDDAAQLMLVVGTNHDLWGENMALATKLQARLEQLQPGICRPMAVRAQRFNQDLSTGAVLIEMGAAGNTLDQAMAAVPTLSRAIIDLARGTS